MSQFLGLGVVFWGVYRCPNFGFGVCVPILGLGFIGVPILDSQISPLITDLRFLFYH